MLLYVCTHLSLNIKECLISKVSEVCFNKARGKTDSKLWNGLYHIVCYSLFKLIFNIAIVAVVMTLCYARASFEKPKKKKYELRNKNENQSSNC